MLNTFIATLNPMLMLFLCIAIGFILNKAKILPENASKVLAKLETWVFCPALSFSTMATYCTVETLGTHAINVFLACCAVSIALAIAIPLSRLFVKRKCSERGIYQYALAFANFGYVGDPVVQALFGDVGLSYYKLFCLPLSVVIYTWGISVLVPNGEKSGNIFKKILNVPTIALILGIIVGVTGLGARMPIFVSNTLNSLKACMGPVAMLLAGFIIANYSLKTVLKNGKVYIATLLRLAVIPAFIVGVIFGIKELMNLIFGMNIGNSVLFLVFFATATPLGLNTVVFPESYGGNPEAGASMATVSHTLCVISIPLLYAVMIAIFGPFSI